MGSRCFYTASAINKAIFLRGASYPEATIWLYGDTDRFYPLFHSRSNHAAFISAGGKGSFHAFDLPSSVYDGHSIGSIPRLWTRLVEDYLHSLDLPYVEGPFFSKLFEWPGYQPTLTPGNSNSRVKAVAPELIADATEINIPLEVTQYAGRWEGWMCRNREVDLKLAIYSGSEQITTVAFPRGSVRRGRESEFINTDFDGIRLTGIAPSGAQIFLQIRDDGYMDVRHRIGETTYHGILQKSEN